MALAAPAAAGQAIEGAILGKGCRMCVGVLEKNLEMWVCIRCVFVSAYSRVTWQSVYSPANRSQLDSQLLFPLCLRAISPYQMFLSSLVCLLLALEQEIVVGL